MPTLRGLRALAWRWVWPAVRPWVLDRAFRVPQRRVDQVARETGVDAAVVRRIFDAAAAAVVTEMELAAAVPAGSGGSGDGQT